MIQDREHNTRRTVLKGLLYGGIAATAGYLLRASTTNSSEEVQKFDPLYFEGDGFAIEREEESVFRIIDTRYGNSLPEDRVPYLHKIAGFLQDDFGCDITKTREDNHDLLVAVDNPQCMLDARDKIQEKP